MPAYNFMLQNAVTEKCYNDVSVIISALKILIHGSHLIFWIFKLLSDLKNSFKFYLTFHHFRFCGRVIPSMIQQRNLFEIKESKKFISQNSSIAINASLLEVDLLKEGGLDTRIAHKISSHWRQFTTIILV